MFVSGILRRSAAAAIAVRAYEEGLTKKEKKSPNFVEYVLNFWDFDNSFYVNLKNKTKKGSIERDHCLNMLGTFKKNFLPHIDQSLKLSEITQNDIETVIVSLIDEGKISAATINNVILSVQKPLNEAFARGMIKTNPRKERESVMFLYQKRWLRSLYRWLIQILIRMALSSGLITLQILR